MKPRIFDTVPQFESLSETLVQYIADAIIDGRLEPGARLKESDLAEQLDVSRIPVREALQELEQIGLVKRKHRKGTFVSQLTEQDILELYTIRAPLEGLAARLIAEQSDEQTITRLQYTLEKMREAAVNGSREGVIRADADFHDTLVEGSDHKLLQEVWEIVGMRLRLFLSQKQPRSYRLLEDAVLMHVPIIEAIIAGDAEEAELEARRHIQRNMHAHQSREIEPE